MIKTRLLSWSILSNVLSIIITIFPTQQAVAVAAAVAATASSAQQEPAVVVACVGDSITDGSCCGLAENEIYPVQLQHILGTESELLFDVRNYGILSRTASRACVPSYWDAQQYDDALQSQADVVLVMLGTNDAKQNFWGPTTCARNFVDDVHQLLSSFQNMPSMPTIYVMLPPRVCGANPCCGITNDNVLRGVIPAVQDAVTSFILTNTIIRMLDIYNLTAAHCHDWYNPDGVHLNAVGAHELAQFLAIVILESVDIPSTALPSTAPTTENGLSAVAVCCGIIVSLLRDLLALGT